MIAAPLKFTAEDAQRAYDTWGANCGPGAIAAICGLTLDELRPLLGDFEAKRYTNPTLMWETLGRIEGIEWRKITKPKDHPTLPWPRYGLARVQWEGPWTEPDMPGKWAYRQTHWVGADSSNPKNIGIFDINCLGGSSHAMDGWTSLKAWSEIMVPYILKEAVPRANGKWHLTHVVEITPC
jgi:hypothetical protein